MAPKLFLTGEPGCGKTTAVRRVVEALRGQVRMAGFITDEVRGPDGRRSGFQGVTLEGGAFPLARLSGSGTFRVGPYVVDVASLENVGVPTLVATGDAELVVLDEVGKMECFSEAFRAAVEGLLAAPTPLLATVAVHGVGFPKKIRHDARIELIRMNRDGRDAIVAEILRRLSQAGIGPKQRPREAGRRRA
jgi:nucleoside-triphosphatase